MKRQWLSVVLTFILILFTCSACTKESPPKPATGGNESKFAVNQADPGAAESSSEESSSAESSAPPKDESSEQESSTQDSSMQESSETSSKPQESSSEVQEESSEEPEEESSEEPPQIGQPSGEYTDSQLGAWNEAEDIYLQDGIGNSYDGLVQKVMDAGFDYEDAVWAVDNLTEAFPIDWYDEALWYAQSIVEQRATYRSSVSSDLRNCLFTEDQIDYAIENIDWYAEAVDEADHYFHILESTGYNVLLNSLLNKDYTYDEAVWGVDTLVEQNSIDWNSQALRLLKRALSVEPRSKSELISDMEDAGYSESEIEYAFANYGEIDWMAQAVEAAGIFIEYRAVSESYLAYLLEDKGFTSEEVSYATSYYTLDTAAEAAEFVTTYLASYSDSTYDDVFSYMTGSPYYFSDSDAAAACLAAGLTP